MTSQELHPGSPDAKGSTVRHLQVTINGRASELVAGATIGSYVDGLGRGRKGIAVAIGDTIVRRALWDATVLKDGDRVEILTAAQGG
jgi:sulfur carrier protein